MLKNKNTIYIYAGFDSLYYSFYLQGIKDYSEINHYLVKFTGGRFTPQFRSVFAFQFLGKRIIIDSMDTAAINIEALNWCDIYGKANYSEKHLPDNNNSIVVPIGPSFGVRMWPLHQALFMAFTNALIAKVPVKNIRRHFADYYRQYKYRIPESQYFPGKTNVDYIFFASTIWKNAHQTNHYRKLFVEICKSIEEIHFEGGFVYRQNYSDGFENLLIDRKYQISDYITKVKQSLVGFSTPAAKDCHGWKLGEYLALGKAVISTPLTRKMPETLIHGKHIHFVDGSKESICDAIRTIRGNPNYRTRLENNARQYYLNYLAPECVIERLLRLPALQ